jgi:hypothetical protein
MSAVLPADANERPLARLMPTVMFAAAAARFRLSGPRPQNRGPRLAAPFACLPRSILR